MEHCLFIISNFIFLISLLFFLCRDLGGKRSRHKKNNKETWKNKVKNDKRCSIVLNKTYLNNY